MVWHRDDEDALLLLGWELRPAKLASYCDNQNISLYTYKHGSLECPENLIHRQ